MIDRQGAAHLLNAVLPAAPAASGAVNPLLLVKSGGIKMVAARRSRTFLPQRSRWDR